MSIKGVVFDIGGVLIEWDPRHLYRKLLPSEGAVEDFLEKICTYAWNLEQDRGRLWGAAISELSAIHPQHEPLIRAYFERWHEMVPGAIAGTVDLLQQLQARGVPVYALTNFSRENFDRALERFPFFGSFDGIVVSADEGLIKPEPEIYARLIGRYNLNPAEYLFIDDREENIRAAQDAGFSGHVFRSPEVLREALLAINLL